jgi:serine/threonine protein kinase
VAQARRIDQEELTWVGSAGASHSGSRGLRPGLVISDRYRVGSLLGSGGMGLVYEAEHLGLRLPVAIKVLRPELIEERGHVTRFLHEARCTARLRGQHVVRVLDQGRLETGLPFFVMERLHGLDLRAVLQACSVLPIALSVDYARQACAALAEAHAAEIVHCDVKPANLFVASEVSNQSRIKLLDFGVARHDGLDDDGEQFGTRTYAAPEQLAAPHLVDHRSDIWSLGAVLFEAVVGAPPTVTDRLGQRCLETGALDDRADIPEALRAIIRRCLAEQKAARFSSVLGLAAALAPFGICAHDESGPLDIPRSQGRGARGAPHRRLGFWGDALRAFPPARRAGLRQRPGPSTAQHPPG